MDKIVFNISKKTLFFVLLIFLVSIMLLLSLNKTGSEDLYNQIFSFCKNNKELKLSEITNFEWDIAYVERQYYHEGTELQEKYKIEGNFKTLPTDFSSRIAFVKDGKLVYDMVLNNFYFEFDSSVEIIEPNSTYVVNWVTIPEQKEKKLTLLLK